MIGNNPPPVTICVLTYGDYVDLAISTIESILRNCERPLYRLVVGANAVGLETRRYLERLEAAGAIDRLHISEVNINKCPMMRRMFADIDTEFIWWFDDDSYILAPNALLSRLHAAREASSRVAIWGHQFFFGHERDFSYGADVVGFVQRAPWYRGKEPPRWDCGGPGVDGRWFFITGGCWFVRTAAIRALDWPDPRLVKRNDDVLLCEALRQQDWTMQDIGPLGVAINTQPRRGTEEDATGLKPQIGIAPSAPGCLFIPTFRDSDLLEANFGGRPELSGELDIHVFDDNFERDENIRVERLCRENHWRYHRSNRPSHGSWEDDQADLSGFNRFAWESLTGLGEHYDFVIKIDTDAYIIDPGWSHEIGHLLSGRKAIAGTPEYRPVRDVTSFWALAKQAGFKFDLSEYVMHVQGGIYGFSRSALRSLREMGFLAGKHVFLAEDCYLSYACWLLGVEFLATTTIGSWYRPYRPKLEEISRLKAIHPLTRSEWTEFLRHSRSDPGQPDSGREGL